MFCRGNNRSCLGFPKAARPRGLKVEWLETRALLSVGAGGVAQTLIAALPPPPAAADAGQVQIAKADIGSSDQIAAVVGKPDLTPYQPSGWSNKIVISNVTGTNTDNSPLSPTDTLYIDWAAINSGTAATSATFATALVVDGKLITGWTTTPPLNANSYAYVQDYSIGSLPAGSHWVGIAVDALRKVSESNEQNNIFYRTFTVSPASNQPNLTPYQPSGWSDKIVVSNATGTHTDSNPLSPTDTLYVDWAAINSGTAATSAAFASALYVDGQLKTSWNTSPPLNANNYAYVQDYAIGSLPSGSHTIEIRVDTANAVAESNEADNIYTKTILVSGGTGNHVTLVPHYMDSAGEGFNDPVLGAARRAAYQYAMGIWSQYLVASYPGETITIDATMDPLGGTANSAVLGMTGPKNLWINFGGGQANTFYADALANHLHGSDLSSDSEMVAQFNTDVDNSTVLGSENWYYGTDGNSGTNVDFVSVVLHEMGHGLNFLDTINTNGSWADGSHPGVYDKFLQTGSTGGTALTAMTNAQRAAAIIGNNLYWNGANGIAGDSGIRPKLFAPNPYQSGSSVAHTDETIYRNDLMSPVYSGPDHTPSAMDLGMFADMGWTLSSGAASVAAPASAGLATGGLKSVKFGRLIPESFVLPGDSAVSAATIEKQVLAGAVDWILSGASRHAAGSDSGAESTQKESLAIDLAGYPVS